MSAPISDDGRIPKIVSMRLNGFASSRQCLLPATLRQFVTSGSFVHRRRSGPADKV